MTFQDLKIEAIPVHPNFISGKWDLPTYQSQGAAAIDLVAAIDKPLILLPGEHRRIPTGIAIHISNPGVVGLIAPRSGLGSNKGLVLGNLIGVIDSDFQAELEVCLYNRNHDRFAGVRSFVSRINSDMLDAAVELAASFGKNLSGVVKALAIPPAEPIIVNPGDRVAQMLFVPVFRPDFLWVNEFSTTTERGAKGFGSTGVSSNPDAT